MKYLLTIIVVFFTITSREYADFNKDICFDDLMIPNLDLLCTVVWGECRGCTKNGQIGVLNVIQNRIEHKDFPSTLDSVLLQPYQFHVDTTLVVPTEFKEMVDSLYQIKPSIPYLYFVNFDKLTKKPKWVKRKRWVKMGKHSFAK